MKERPIIFNAFSVNAILEGRKTQTRRIVEMRGDPECIWCKGKGYEWIDAPDHLSGYDYRHPCHCILSRGMYGKLDVGDRLWVRETIRLNPEEIYYKADEMSIDLDKLTHEQIEWLQSYDGLRHNITIPSIHMKRYLSRIILEIIKIQVERLKDGISREDCIKEGMKGSYTEFRIVWNKINAKRGHGWNTNPFVWVIEFKRLKNDH